MLDGLTYIEGALMVFFVLLISSHWFVFNEVTQAAASADVAAASAEQNRQHTMCDFHDFGLIFARQMHCLPQRLKSTLFEIFSNGGCPKGTRSVLAKMRPKS